MSLCAAPNYSNRSPNNGKRGVRFGYITGLAARWARFKWQCTKHISATWLSLDEKYLTWPTNTSVTLSGSFSSATLWALSQSWLWTYLKHDWIGHISLTSKRERLIWKGVQCSLINFKRCAKNYSWETSARLLFTSYNKNWLGFFFVTKITANQNKRNRHGEPMKMQRKIQVTGPSAGKRQCQSRCWFWRESFFSFTQSLY